MIFEGSCSTLNGLQWPIWPLSCTSTITTTSLILTPTTLSGTRFHFIYSGLFPQTCESSSSFDPSVPSAWMIFLKYIHGYLTHCLWDFVQTLPSQRGSSSLLIWNCVSSTTNVCDPSPTLLFPMIFVASLQVDFF